MSAATTPSRTSARTRGLRGPRGFEVALCAIFCACLASGCLAPTDDHSLDDEDTSEVYEAIVEEADDVDPESETDDEGDGLNGPLVRLPQTDDGASVRPGDTRAEPEPIPWHGIGDPHANTKP
jgi:hypothetical protein